MIGELILWFETGKNNVIGRIQSVISLVLMVGTFLKVWETTLGITITLDILLVFGITIIIFNFIIGYIYCKSGLMEKETRARYNMVPQVQETNEMIKELMKRNG